MTKNTKIALGCGGAGCLGLIVVVVAGGLLWFFMMRTPTRSYNFNTNSNTSRNSNVSTNRNSNTDSNSSNSSSSSSSSSSMSDDDKHKLYQAATMTGDQATIRRVSVKLGLMNEDYTPGDDYVTFVKDHVVWAFSNADFIQSLDTKEKAVAYVNEHFPE
jgi:hypothetical protein